MTARYLVTPSALRDIDAILEFVLENSGPSRALHVHRRLYESFKKIGAHPGLGHIRDDLADESLRVHSVFSYIIVYCSETKPVQIIRVIHGARDVSNALMDDA